MAIFDLLEDNHFAPAGLDSGPYHLHLSIEDNRLAMHINDTDDQAARHGSWCRYRPTAG